MQPTSGYKSGTISAQNSNPNSGVATANSTVQLPQATDYDTVAIQVAGTYTGALSLQGTVDGTNWITLGGAQALTNINTGAQVAAIPSAATGIWQADVSGFQSVRISANAAVTGSAVVSIAGTAQSGVVGIDTPIQIATGQAVTVAQPSPSAISLNSAATTNATNSKATAGSLFEISASNMTASIKYLKLYNKATAPTVGTDVPVLTIPIPANGMAALEFGANGKRFTTGIAFAITGLQAIADATAVAAGDVQVHGSYI